VGEAPLARPAGEVAVRPGSVIEDGGSWGTEAHADAAFLAAWERMERRVAAAMARARESVVALEYTALEAPAGPRRVASGVVINNRGEILSIRIDPPQARPAPGTGRNLAPIVARDCSGRCHHARWLAADAKTGLTLLQVSSRAVRPIRTTADEPTLGSPVFVVGNPFGMGHSVSRGYVAGLDRALELGTGQLGGLIQIQVALYPGDSGAAVVNLRGDWLGLIRSGLAIPGSGAAAETTPGDSLAGPVGPASPPSSPAGQEDAEAVPDRPEPDTDFGFAIPAHHALWIADQLRAHGRVDRAYLGVRLEPVFPTSASVPAVTPGEVDASGPPAIDGAILYEVLDGSPAARAGLRPGDRIIEFNGQLIHSPYDLIDRLDRMPAGTTIRLSVVRGDGPQRRSIAKSLRTASRPDSLLANLDPAALTPSSPSRSGPESLPRPSSNASVSVPVTPTAARTAPASAPTRSEPAPSPVPDMSSGLRATANPTSQDRARSAATVAPSSTPPLTELRLTLPRAVVDRLEQLERRLEKLETFQSPPTGTGPTSKRQTGSSSKP
jgi:S1-C subfamily serine protease